MTKKEINYKNIYATTKLSTILQITKLDMYLSNNSLHSI